MEPAWWPTMSAVVSRRSQMCVLMCVALPILATTPLGPCCKQEYALCQVAWLNKDEREETPTRRSEEVLLFSGLVCCSEIHV